MSTDDCLDNNVNKKDKVPGITFTKNNRTEREKENEKENENEKMHGKKQEN